jgi:hypothetical protein
MLRISFPSYNSTSADYLPGLVVAYMVAGLMIQPNSGHGERIELLYRMSHLCRP